MEPVIGKYRLLIEKLQDGFACHQIITDSSGKPVDYVFLEVNPAFEKMTGLSRDNILNKRVTEVLPGLKKSSFDWIGTYGKVALTGEKASFESFSEPLKRWYEVTAYSDAPGYFTTLFREKETEEMLHKSEEFFRNLAENSQDFIFRCRFIPELCYEYISPSVTAVTGYTPEEHYSDPNLVLKIVHPDELPILEKIKSGTVSHDRPFTVRYVRKNGEIIWTEQHKPFHRLVYEGLLRHPFFLLACLFPFDRCILGGCRCRFCREAIPDLLLLESKEFHQRHLEDILSSSIPHNQNMDQMPGGLLKLIRC